MRRLGLLQDPNAEQRSEQHRDDPGREQCDRDDGENRESVFAGTAVREPDGHEARDRDQRAREHRKCGRGVSERRGLLLVVTVLQPRDHRFDRDHRVIDQQPECDDEGAQRNPLKVDPDELIATNTAASTSGMDSATTAPARRPRLTRLTAKDDGDGLPQRLHEVVHGMLDGHGLIGDERRLDPDRQVRRDLGHGVLDIAAQRQHVAAFAHGDREPDALTSVDAEHRLRRVGGAARDMRDVAQPNDPAVLRDEVDGEHVLLGPERARDADEDLLVPGLHDARGRDGVLRLQRGDERGTVDPEARQLLLREFDIDALVLRAEDVDFGDVRQPQELLADVDDVVPQFPVREAVRGEAVDDAVGIAELVVEAGADDALRQRVARCRPPSCAPGTRCPAPEPAASNPSG